MTSDVYASEPLAINRDVLLPHLADVLRDARLDAGLSLRDMEGPTGLERGSVHRFETHKSGWPRNPDEIVNAYAQACERLPVELWTLAVQRWESAESAVGGLVRRALREGLESEARRESRPQRKSKSGPSGPPNR